MEKQKLRTIYLLGLFLVTLIVFFIVIQSPKAVSYLVKLNPKVARSGVSSDERTVWVEYDDGTQSLYIIK